MIGKNHQGILVTVAESKSRFVLAGQLHSKHSEGMTKKISSLLHPHKHKYYTVTCDNGKESAAHGTIDQNWKQISISHTPAIPGSGD